MTRIALPEYRHLGDFHQATNPIRLSLRDKRYQAISIAPFSTVDKIYVRHDGRNLGIGVAIPAIGDFRDSIELYPWYSQGTSATYSADLAISLWPEVPNFPIPPRGPEVLADWLSAGAPTGAEALHRRVACYGRSAVRVYAAAASADVTLRIEAEAIQSTSAVHVHTLWPTAGDSSTTHNITSGTAEFTIDVEGWQFIKLMALGASATAFVTRVEGED